ncbi:MAG: DUF4445 domain-containing protein [Anaerolineae bacterium]|nr:DUF4445 domain-containing protein [Anaerolineae bacterium]
MPQDAKQPGSNHKTHRVVFQPAGRQGWVPDGITILEAARLLGVEIESICGGRQTCGKCRIIIEEGTFPKLGIRSSREHVTPVTDRERRYAERFGLDLEHGHRLSCAARVQGDLLITVPEESQARKQVIRKAAREMSIKVDPAVRLCYIELERPTLEHPRGEWERAQEELATRFGLDNLTIDITALRDLQAALRKGQRGITCTIWQEREVIRVQPGYHEEAYGLAVDVGTTTVAAYLCDLLSGEVIASEAIMNPQVTYGEDLMSRVSFAMSEVEGLDRMHRAIIEGLNDVADRAARSAGITRQEITDLVLVGNTVMHHVLLGIDPRELGGMPFPAAVHGPLDYKARDLGLSLAPGAMVHVLPIEAGYVGADNVGVILAEEPHKVPPDEIVLIIDVGTNGELLLGNSEHLLCCSSPTGPAFEGAQIVHGMRATPGAIERVRVDPETLEVRFRVIGESRWSDEWTEENPPAEKARGICGSGIIEAVAELFKAGVIDRTGRFVRDCPSPRYRREGNLASFVLAWPHETSTGQEIALHTDDVRAIQLAKAALYSSARILMRRRGVDHVDRVILAGAFGSYIDPEHAMTIGMLPDCDLEHVYAVGNAAGDGARIALLNRDKRLEAARVARQVEFVETAAEPDFQDQFVSAIYLPHMFDEFPHLEHILSKIPNLKAR